MKDQAKVLQIFPAEFGKRENAVRRLESAYFWGLFAVLGIGFICFMAIIGGVHG